MAKVRLQDVAARAGVSPATVTRVLHGRGYVSAEKKALVEAAMRELGYVFTPSPEAAGCAGPYVIVISRVGSNGNPLFHKIAERLGIALQAQGWLMMHYYLQNEGPMDLVRILERMRGPGLKGIVFNCIGDSVDFLSIRRYLIDLPTCLVMVERFPDIYGLNKVMLNAREMVFVAVRHLAHLGHRHIVFFGVDDEREVERSRKEGFLFGTNAMGVAEHSAFWPISDYLCLEGYAGMEAYVRRHGLPTAVIAPDPVMVGVSNYLYRMGCRVPEDVSLLGLDDTLAQYASPRNSSIAYPLTEMVKNILSMLLEYEAGNTLPQNVLLSTMLVERGSCAPPRAGDPPAAPTEGPPG